MQVAFDDDLFAFLDAGEDVDPAVTLGAGLHGTADVAPGRFLDQDVALVADQENRTLDEALQEATLIVSCPHSGSAVPEEVA